MSRRLHPACAFWLSAVAASITAPAALGQTPFARDLVPSRGALARVGLERAWYAVVPLNPGVEKVVAVSMADSHVFAQTNGGNFHVFDAETGRHLWAKGLGPGFPTAQEPAVNSNSIFVANGNELFALDRRTGRTLWNKHLESFATSPVAANEDRVLVGLRSGKLVAFNVKARKTLNNRFNLEPGTFVYNWQTNGPITSRPIPADQLVAVASNDGKVYVFIDSADVRSYETPGQFILYRWRSEGPIVASMGTYGVRTLLVPSHDKHLYAIDLIDGETKWTFPSGAPIDAEPLVGDRDTYVVNTEGSLSAIDDRTGQPRWTLPSGAARLLAVGAKRIYARSRDGDLVVVDRQSGALLFNARATRDRAGLNFRDYNLPVTNSLNDRVYLGTSSGMIVALREQGETKPRLIRHPSSVPFGHVKKDVPGQTPPAQVPGIDKPADDPEKAEPKDTPKDEPKDEPKADKDADSDADPK